jgi:predicted HicB family RNase H-like nuclease
MVAVTDWPTYLLKGVPADVRAALSAEAERQDISVADIVRQALCAFYRLDCEPASTLYQPNRDMGSGVLVLRLQPELYRLIKKDTRNRYGAVKTLIMQALTTHLEEPQ